MTEFVCPKCHRSAFHALMPIWDYTPHRWLAWLPPRKRWIGDLVVCANLACQARSVAGYTGVIEYRGEPSQNGATPPVAPPTKPATRHINPVPDPDMPWFRD